MSVTKLSGNIQSGDGRTAFHSITMINLQSENCSLIFFNECCHLECGNLLYLIIDWLSNAWIFTSKLNHARPESGTRTGVLSSDGL